MEQSIKQYYQDNVDRPNVGRSSMDLSHRHLTSCDMGMLVPTCRVECVPGDFLRMRQELVCRLNPLVSPVLSNIFIYTHYFFIPYRLLWNDYNITGMDADDLVSVETSQSKWTKFITGGEEGILSPTAPKWIPQKQAKDEKFQLWDYYGFGMDYTSIKAQTPNVLPHQALRTAYNFIFNEFYRDENLMPKVPLNNSSILYRCWEKDYFTSSLPFQQRGIAPSIPLSGTASSLFTGPTTQGTPPDAIGMQGTRLATNSTATAENFKGWLGNNSIDLSNLGTFTISDLRFTASVQSFMETNARCGARLNEFLKGHFGVSPDDKTLQRPEYIGGTKSPIIISDVPQTSQTTEDAGAVKGSPQGTLAGQGLTADTGEISSYRVEEFGVVIGLTSIMPDLVYNSQGIPRNFTRNHRYDFYFPEFANLSEQAIQNSELYYGNDILIDDKIFGYQGRYDELRIQNSYTSALMRNDFQHWHLARDVSSTVALNPEFLKCQPRKNIFAVENEHGFMIDIVNDIEAVRPVPAYPIPKFGKF